MNGILNFIISGLSYRKEELKTERLKIERFMELQISEGFITL